MTHLSCPACQMRFDSRRMPDLEQCPDCQGPLDPVSRAAALGLRLYRGATPVPAARWTVALAAALRDPARTRRP